MSANFTPEGNLRSSDRILKLEVMDGKKPLSSLGNVDTRLFTEGQNLHLKMEPETCLWYFQYSQNGLLPEALKGKFTSAKAGVKHAEDYYVKRNVRITKIVD